MTLSELPAMLVERMERTESGLTVYGRFDRLDGVREAGCFRLERGQYAWAELVVVDRAAGVVVATDALDPDIARLCVGRAYTWFHDYWQVPLVEAIADETTNWQQFQFKATDAQYFRQGESTGWQEVGRRLPDGAVDLGIKPGGWDHEHCGLCDRHIDATNPLGYTDPERHFLCSSCYEKFGASHDLSFQLGA